MNKIKLGNKDFYYQVFYKNIKNIYLRLNKDILKVTCNKKVSLNQIESFIYKSERNILNKAEIQSKKVSLYSKERMLIFGEEYLIIYNLSRVSNSYFMNDSEIVIDFRKDCFDLTYIEKIYKELLMDQMNKIYSMEYSSLSRYLNIDNLVFKVQLMKSRYGSCIPKKRIIKLNSILARFKIDYLRAVLIHELIHLEVHNHQKEFYKYINILVPEYKQSIKTLSLLSRKYVI